MSDKILRNAAHLGAVSWSIPTLRRRRQEIIPAGVIDVERHLDATVVEQAHGHLADRPACVVAHESHSPHSPTRLGPLRGAFGLPIVRLLVHPRTAGGPSEP